MEMEGVEIWVWKGGKGGESKRYMCWSCEGVYRTHEECLDHMKECADTSPSVQPIPFLQAMVLR